MSVFSWADVQMHVMFVSEHVDFNVNFVMHDNCSNTMSI
jgi:hypothetical protein